MIETSRYSRIAAVSSVAIALVVTALLSSTMINAQQRDLPEEFEQVIPRGRIAAINKPEFVPASEAQIRDDAWVLGVVIDGQARAYSISLLNAHEVVNDTIGGTNFAAVW